MRLALFRMAHCVVSLAVLGLTSLVAQAAIVVSAETVSAAPGSTGYVEVFLQNSSAVPEELSAFSGDLVLSGSGVRFTGVDDQTTRPYVFGSEGTGVLSFDSFPNTGFIASDISLNAAGFVSLLPGATYGLARVQFDVASAASGGLRPITFKIGPTTELVNELGVPYAAPNLAFTSGGINVLGPVAAVPEPSSTAIFLIGSGSTILAARKRSRRTAS